MLTMNRIEHDVKNPQRVGGRRGAGAASSSARAAFVPDDERQRGCDMALRARNDSHALNNSISYVPYYQAGQR